MVGYAKHVYEQTGLCRSIGQEEGKYAPTLAFTARVANNQAERERLFVVEQPQRSLALREPPIKKLRNKFQEIALDMSTQDLRDPWSKEPLQKGAM